MFRRLTCLFVLALTTILLCGVAGAEVVPGYEFVPGEVIVKFHPGLNIAQKQDLFGELNGEKLKSFRMGAEHWRMTDGDVYEAVSKLEADPRVEYAQPNYVVYALEVPDDSRFDDLWGMHNTGQTGGTPDADIDAVEAWDVYTGTSDVLVAVIDTGVDYDHPDLVDNIWTNPGEIPGNGIDDDNNGWVDDIHGYDFYNNDADPMDDNGHGSHCSGTIGGVGNNGIGVAGVAWDVSIMGLKFLSSGGSGSTADAVSCVEYATAMGVDIMSNSWGGGPFETVLETAIADANAAGIFFIAAAGNSGSDNDVNPHYPSSYEVPNVIAVMATNHNDQRVVEPGWWTSSIGATSVDIAAPGLHIWSTTPNNTYSDYSGTSMATPHVAGAVALLRGRFPNISVADGKNLLMTIGNDILPQLDGMCVTSARLNVLKLIGDPDEIPPSAVNDLAVAGAASNWIEVQWTAPGDDDMVGTASSYDMRWALAPIMDEAAWDAAMATTGAPDPGPAGTPETMQIGGLDFNTTYYFSVRAKDEYGNLGGLSNSPAGTTLGIPVVHVAPTSLSTTLETGGTDLQTLTISNVGEGVLDFQIPTAEYIIPAKASFPAVQQHEAVYLPKGAVDNRPALLGSGGPDAFGYNWADSDEAGGPAFNWIEISTLGTPVSLVDDQVTAAYPLGFVFPFYGNDFAEFKISSNGFVTFTDNDAAASNQPVPSVGAPFNLIAPFWDDLNPATGGTVYYHSDGARLVVQWDNVPHYDGGGVYTFQVQIYPNGVIEYHFLSMSPPSDSATVGIQNADGTDGLQAAFNTAYVHDILAVRFARVNPWLTTGPNSGSVAAGASIDVDVMFDATGLCGSHFDANLHVVSNDPVTPDAVVPVGLDLIGTPDIWLSTTALDFGAVYITADNTLDLTVVNNGCSDLMVSGLLFGGVDAREFSTTQTAPFVLIAGASQTVPLIFAPEMAGPRSATLTVESDDADSPAIVVDLDGVGLDFPDIAVDPTELTETLATGGTSTQVVTITNNGLGDLNFTIPEAEYLTAAKKAAPVHGSKAIELGKEDKDPRVGAPVVLGAGGPDLFGYRWSDSDDPTGPAFNWIEIETLGTQLTLSDDDNEANLPIGFDFSYYGNSFNTFNLCSNGWVSFTSTATSLTNYALPSGSAPENLLALFHDDLNPSTGGWVGYHNDGQRLIIEYKDVPRYDSGGPYSMQIHLYPSGAIEYHYLSMQGSRLDEGTVGIQNGTQDDGLTVAFNTGYVHDGLAVRFQSLPSWLTSTPNTGTVAPGASMDVTVGFSAADLCGDQYLANMHIVSNDPDTPDALIPVTLNLLGEPDGIISDTTLDLGSVYLTQWSTLPVTLANAGCASLQVTELTIDNPVFTVDVAAPFSVAVGASMALNVTFSPTAGGLEPGVMTITTDDPDTPQFTVDLTGEGLDLAQISVTPGEINELVDPGTSTTAILHLENTGAGELSWSIPSVDLYNKTVATLGQKPAPEFVEGPKDALDKDQAPGRLGLGGPDAFGYRWTDSDDPDGPVFGWIDISGTGTPAVTTGDDANQGPFPIGFTFKFYDVPFNQFRVCSNGFLSFTSTATTYSNQSLPYASGPFDLVAPFWDDLNLSLTGSGDVYYENVDGNLVVMWDGVLPYNGGTSGAGPFTFEVILTPSGEIIFQYLTLNSAPASATVGIQDGTGTVGLEVAYNTAYLHDDLAIRIAALPEWATVSPTSGVLAAGSGADVSVFLDSAGLDLGVHTGMILVMSNDLANPEVQVPMNMRVDIATAVLEGQIPRVLAMNQNVPNPFNPMTTIHFALPVNGQVDLRVYDVRGALVRTLESGELVAGHHQYVWNGTADSDRPVPSGVYFYRLKAAGEVITRRMTLVK